MILLFHKPKSVVVTTNDEHGRKSVYDLLPVWVRDEGWMPVGRLGRDVLHGAELDAFAGGARDRLDAPS